MISATALTAKIVDALPDAVVTLDDLTGTQDHWKAHVVSAAFAGKSLMQRHRLVMGALAAELKDRTIHALTLDVKTPDET